MWSHSLKLTWCLLQLHKVDLDCIKLDLFAASQKLLRIFHGKAMPEP